MDCKISTRTCVVVTKMTMMSSCFCASACDKIIMYKKNNIYKGNYNDL